MNYDPTSNENVQHQSKLSYGLINCIYVILFPICKSALTLHNKI